ncbi:peptidyl-prolyl cis-trans isomerase [Bhargavaea ullalensis]|uniref:Peptidyl-prolyl cis-trans isomerase n=1 Tax=Bhargavaea ullalensis TaxID=1265685 RepID=A0ABV2GC03_9BACL
MIIPIKGNADYTITLDPGTWIFDDRKIDLNTYFTEEREEKNELDEYVKATSKHWSREIMEGATYPPTLKTERKFKKTELLHGTFGIVLEPFLKNAGIRGDAKEIAFGTADGEEHRFPVEEAYSMIFQFSVDGQPLKEDGPAWLLFPDGSNAENPIKAIRTITII